MTRKETNLWAGQQLAAYRAKAGLTQETLAERSGIRRDVYSGLENGRRTITATYADRLAPCLGLTDPLVLLPPEDQPRHPDSPLDRLEGIEAELAKLERSRARGTHVIWQKLAEIEAALERLELQSARQSTDTSGRGHQ